MHVIGACFVIWGHSHALLGLYPPIVMGEGIHALGLYILFVVSGYLVADSFRRSKSLGNELEVLHHSGCVFLWRRMA